MADEIPVIPKVNVLEVRTGNIVNWNRLKRKPNHTPTGEVSGSDVSLKVKGEVFMIVDQTARLPTGLSCCGTDSCLHFNLHHHGLLLVLHSL